MTTDFYMLMQAFQFSIADLEANRHRRISPAQKKRLRKVTHGTGCGCAMLFFFPVNIVGAVISMQSGSYVIPIVTIVLSCIGMLIIYLGVRLLTVPNRVIVSIGPPIMRQVAMNTQYVYIGNMTITDGPTVRTAMQVLDPQQSYVVYHTGKGHVLSVEPYMPEYRY